MTDLESRTCGHRAGQRYRCRLDVFYEEVLGCLKGPGDEQWLDFNLYGHQVVCRLNPQLGKQGRVGSRYQFGAGQVCTGSHTACVVLDMWKWPLDCKKIKTAQGEVRHRNLPSF